MIVVVVVVVVVVAVSSANTVAVVDTPHTRAHPSVDPSPFVPARTAPSSGRFSNVARVLRRCPE